MQDSKYAEGDSADRFERERMRQADASASAKISMSSGLGALAGRSYAVDECNQKAEAPRDQTNAAPVPEPRPMLNMIDTRLRQIKQDIEHFEHTLRIVREKRDALLVQRDQLLANPTIEVATTQILRACDML